MNENYKKEFKPGDKVRILSEYGQPEATIRSVLGNGNYYLEGRCYEYPRISLMESSEWEDSNSKGPDLNKLTKLLDDSLSKETTESLNSWINEHYFVVGDHITVFGRKGIVTETYPDSPDRVFVDFSDGVGGVYGVGDLEHALSFRIGDCVMVIKGKFRDMAGVVKEIEESEGGYTVDVDLFGGYGSFVHDSSYFRFHRELTGLKRIMNSGEMKDLYESLPESPKIIEDNFFDLVDDDFEKTDPCEDNKVFVAVDKDGREGIYDRGKPYRLDDCWYSDYDKHGESYSYIELPKGSIRKLIGHDLTWEDEPVELKGE